MKVKIYFFWPYIEPITPSSTESYEIFNALHKCENVELVGDYESCDYVIYMMHIRDLLNLPYDDSKNLNMEAVQKMYNFKQHEKEIIIDYNDWTDIRNIPTNIVTDIYKYFKRSIVYKPGSENAYWFKKYSNVKNYDLSLGIVTYPREILPISYGVRTDYIEYDKYYKQSGYIYDVCCMFDGYAWEGGFRTIIPHIVKKYNGAKYVGTIKISGDRYANVNPNYYGVMKHSKIIVTANPTNYEGDFRLWEALLTGNLVLCDRMFTPGMHKHPLIDKTHLVYYDNVEHLYALLKYYTLDANEQERNRIGQCGREHVLKYHKFSDRVNEILEYLL